jgi:hypothetical protein
MKLLLLVHESGAVGYLNSLKWIFSRPYFKWMTRISRTLPNHYFLSTGIKQTMSVSNLIWGAVLIYIAWTCYQMGSMWFPPTCKEPPCIKPKYDLTKPYDMHLYICSVSKKGSEALHPISDLFRSNQVLQQFLEQDQHFRK